MAFTRLKVWTAETLTASDLNAEFNNIRDFGVGIISPLTGTLDLDNNRLDDIHAGTVSDPSINPNSDGNTGIYFPAADQLAITCGGAQVLLATAESLSTGAGNVDGAAFIFNDVTDRTAITSVGMQAHMPAQTQNFDNTSGTIAIGAATFLGAPTWTGDNATLTVTDAAALVVGLPVASTNVAFTNLAHTIHTLGAVWIETSSAGSITADTDGDDLVIENSGDVGMTLLGGTGSNCKINMGDSGDANIGVINYDNNGNTMRFTAGTSTQFLIGEVVGIHVNPTGTPDVDLEVSDGGGVAGGGAVHRASSGAHSARHAKTKVKDYTPADEKKAYNDLKTLKPMRFRYRRGADHHDPNKPGVDDPTMPEHNGYFIDEAPAFITDLNTETITVDDRIMMLEMALKETIRKVELGPPGP